VLQLIIDGKQADDNPYFKIMITLSVFRSCYFLIRILASLSPFSALAFSLLLNASCQLPLLLVSLMYVGTRPAFPLAVWFEVPPSVLRRHAGTI
jgi:hypothetical protein